MDEEKKDVTEKTSESNDVLDDVKDAQTIISISESDVKENIDDIVDDNSADEADEKIVEDDEQDDSNDVFKENVLDMLKSLANRMDQFQKDLDVIVDGGAVIRENEPTVGDFDDAIAALKNGDPYSFDDLDLNL